MKHHEVLARNVSIVAEYCDGASIHFLAEKYGIGSAYLRRILAINGAALRKTEDRKKHKRLASWFARDYEWTALFSEGHTFEEISKKYGCTRQNVQQRLGKLGVSGGDGGRTIRSFKNISDKVACKLNRQNAKEARHFLKWGCSFEFMAAIAPGIKRKEKSHPLRKFNAQRGSAKRRGIEFGLNFREWWDIWQDSGHWNERGRGGGYVMARFGDSGPYVVGNVEIITANKNVSDSYITNPAATRLALRRLRQIQRAAA